MTTQELIQQLTSNARNGDLNINQINDLTYALRQALRQSQRANRSPESYAAAAEKGKATRAQNAANMDATMARSRDMDAQDKMNKQDRIDKGLLPLTADDFVRTPDLKYYEYVGDDQRSGVGMYKLKDEYIDTIMETEDRMNEINTNRWAKLAGINENEDDNLNSTVKQALSTGGYIKINSGTDVQVGKRVLGYDGYFGEIVKIKDGIYKIEDDAYGDKTTVNRKKLEAKFLIEK
jgi:hypothetical protein